MNCPDACFPAWDEPQHLASQAQETDEILRNFLQEMVELDRQPAVESPIAAKRELTAKNSPTLPQQQFDKENKTTEGRQRHKQELQTLKYEAEALENYVQFLKRGHQNLLGLSPQMEQSLQSQNTWLAAATRELQRSQETQQRNTQLKEQVHSCVQIAGALQTVLNAAKTLRNEQLTRNSIASRALRVEMALNRQQLWADATTANIYNMLEASVIARSDEMKSIVAAEMSQPMLTTDSEEIQICRKNESCPTVKFKTARVLPFDVETVSHVCWNECATTRPGIRVVMRSEGMISTDLSMPVPLENGEVVEIRVFCVIKRLMVQGSFVVIAQSLTEWPAHLAASGAWSRATRESSWGVVHMYPTLSNRTAGTPPISVSRFLMQMSSMPTGTDSDTTRKLLNSPAVSDVIIPSFRRLIHNRQQAVDNLLMDFLVNREYQ